MIKVLIELLHSFCLPTKPIMTTTILLSIALIGVAQSTEDSSTRKNKFEIKVVPCKCDSTPDSTIISLSAKKYLIDYIAHSNELFSRNVGLNQVHFIRKKFNVTASGDKKRLTY